MIVRMETIMRQAFALLFAFSSIALGSKTLRFGNGGHTPHHFRRLMEAGYYDEEELDADHPKFLYPEHRFTIPVNHFPNDPQYAPHDSHTFRNRYWFDASHYKPGGPVIIFQAGEASAVQRLPLLQNGIPAKLAEATNGISVIFEHRFYGRSVPTKNLSIENLRFLTTEQAMADEAFFAQHIKFPGMEQHDLSSNSTAWFSYGGSYGGAFSAFLRQQYPEVFWGAISSSGVTKEAIWDYWEYYAPIAEYGPTECIRAQQLFTNMSDNILIGKNQPTLTHKLKELFNMPNVTYNNDFANQLAMGISQWQDLNWNPAVSYDGFYWFCGNISSDQVLFPKTESKRSAAEEIMKEGGHTPNTTIVNQLLNYVGWLNQAVVAPCAAEGNTQDECFTTHNKTFYEQDGRAEISWRSWSYQYCTQWGFLQTGSGVPADQLPLISRTIDLEYSSIICRDAFNRTEPADVEITNKHGGYNISHSRLAIIDGQWDPWRPATPHAFKYGASHRTSTASEPFILIDRALHHYDENGVYQNQTTSTFPPKPVESTQLAEEVFVKHWLEEWRAAKHPKKFSRAAAAAVGAATRAEEEQELVL